MKIFSKFINELVNLGTSVVLLFSPIYNLLVKIKNGRVAVKAELKELEEIKTKALIKTDISDHLVPLFVESLSLKPKFIVELGVRGGESTFVLERVAQLCDSTLLSVDIEDCSRVSAYKKWTFVKRDDITFAKEFRSWCGQHGVEPRIDVLFIDTSHLYEHTVEEIRDWFPFLSDRAKVFFHDTNLRKFVS